MAYNTLKRVVLDNLKNKPDNVRLDKFIYLVNGFYIAEFKENILYDKKIFIDIDNGACLIDNLFFKESIFEIDRVRLEEITKFVLRHFGKCTTKELCSLTKKIKTRPYGGLIDNYTIIKYFTTIIEELNKQINKKKL